MTLLDPVHATVAAVGEVLADARDPWWIITGAAAAIYGARPISVSDVDVMLSVEDAKRLFPRIGLVPAPPSNHPRFRSEVFGQWTQCPLVVEFMANFRLRDQDGIWRPMELKTRRSLNLGTTTIYLPEIEELRAMFQRFGRPKDLERIQLLDQLT